MYLFIEKKGANIFLITDIKKCELPNTTVYLNNYLLLPNMEGGGGHTHHKTKNWLYSYSLEVMSDMVGIHY